MIDVATRQHMKAGSRQGCFGWVVLVRMVQRWISHPNIGVSKIRNKIHVDHSVGKEFMIPCSARFQSTCRLDDLDLVMPSKPLI
jgi:hypothetical protein